MFEEHNQEVKGLWDDYQKGTNGRVPVSWSIGDKVLLLNPELNRSRCAFEDYFNDPEVMLRVQLDFEHWRRHNVWADWEMGLPDKWDIGVNFQNVYESAWLGCDLFYAGGQVPDVRAFLSNKEKIVEFMG